MFFPRKRFCLWLVSPGFFFCVCVFGQQKKCGGRKPIIINFGPPKFVFRLSKTPKKTKSRGHKPQKKSNKLI